MAQSDRFRILARFGGKPKVYLDLVPRALPLSRTDRSAGALKRLGFGKMGRIIQVAK